MPQARVTCVSALYMVGGVPMCDDSIHADNLTCLAKVVLTGYNFCPTTKMNPVGLVADTEEFIRRMRLREFFHKPQDASSEPNETTNEPEQSMKSSVVQQPKKKESNWTPPKDRCPRLDTYAQAVRRCINATFISRAQKIAQDVTQAQRNAIHGLKTNHNIVIKPADR
eukprot:g34917.t1